MVGNKFYERKSDTTVTVISDNKEIVLLSTGEKVDKNYLLTSGEYSAIDDGAGIKPNHMTKESMDPSSFMNQSALGSSMVANSLFNQLSNIDTSNISDNIHSGPTVEIIESGDSFDRYTNDAYYKQDLEAERMEMQKKLKNYKAPKVPYIDDEIEDEFMQSNPQRRDIFSELEDIDKRSSSTMPNPDMRAQRRHPVIQEPVIQEPTNPLLELVKQAKKVNKFKANIAIDSMLPKYDLIKMFEESYDLSIIDILADEMIDKIIEDRETLRDKIKAEIKAKVYPKPRKTTKATKSTKQDGKV